jgi:Tfp pilus assembly protein PilE
MITVAIVGILAAIAYPSYRNYILRGQIVDATNGLSALRANMERYFQDNRSYATVSTTLPSPCDTPGTIGSFTLSCTATAATATASATFQLTATGSHNTAGFVFTVDQTGAQSTTVTGVRGWNSCGNAWVTKAGQTC